MSDQEIGKKEVEWMELDPFITEYAYTVGDELQVVGHGERPAIVCARQNGCNIGVELTKIIEPSKLALTFGLVDEADYLSAMDCAWTMSEAIASKETKRRQPDWTLPNATLLVLQVMNTPVDELVRFLADGSLKGDFAGHGFLEVWIANYTTVDEFRTVELYGLHPERWWGPHQRSNWWKKPYG
jgi:hypothetical protein